MAKVITNQKGALIYAHGRVGKEMAEGVGSALKDTKALL